MQGCELRGGPCLGDLAQRNDPFPKGQCEPRSSGVLNLGRFPEDAHGRETCLKDKIRDTRLSLMIDCDMVREI